MKWKRLLTINKAMFVLCLAVAFLNIAFPPYNAMMTWLTYVYGVMTMYYANEIRKEGETWDNDTEEKRKDKPEKKLTV